MSGKAPTAPPEGRLARFRAWSLRYAYYHPLPAFLIVLAIAFAGTLGVGVAVGVWPGEVISDSGAYATSLAVDSAGALHLLFTNTSLVYATNAAGAWTARVIDANWSYAPSIAIDSKRHVHVVEDVFNTTRDDAYLGEVRYFTEVDGVWSERTIAKSGAVPSMVIDDADVVHIVYLWTNDSTSGTRWTDFHYVTERDGTWTDTVVYSTPYDLTIDSTTAIAATDSGRVAITLSAGVYFLGYLTNESGNWTFTWVTDVRSSGGLYGPAPVAIDSAGHSHLIYTTYDASANTTTVVQAVDSDGQWNVEPIELVNGPITCSMVLDATNHVHLAFVDPGGGLLYLTNLHGSWSADLVDQHASLYTRPSLAVLPSGDAAIAYQGVRPPSMGSSFSQPFLRIASDVVAGWNAPDFLSKEALFLTVAFIAAAVVIRTLAGRKRF